MQKASIYPLGGAQRLRHWRDRLSAQAGLTADPLEQVQITYYDSFDGRLYAAGYSLEQTHTAAGAELRLLRDSGRQLQAALAAALPVSGFPADLPPGELRRRLEKLLDMRALLPVATLQVRRYPLRGVDDEGKTRVRLQVESVGLLDGGGKPRMLQKRLLLQPLRGYAKSARRLAAGLARDFALETATDDLYALALAATGKRPGEDSGKLDIQLQGDMRADAAARHIAARLFATLQANEAGALDGLDSEFLHDFRVAVRRTRSLLDELKHVFPASLRQRFTAEFAWLGNLTGTLRDLDVYLLKFASYRAVLPSELRPALEPLRTFLLYKQQQERVERLTVALQGKRYHKLKQRWQRYLDAPLAKRPVARDALKRIDRVAHRRTWRTYKRILAAGQAINADSPPGELHALRKACKKLRYLMEFFQSLYPPEQIQVAIKALKQLQDNLGDFQDLEVQVVSLRRFAMEMRRRGEYSAATGEAMAVLLETLETRRHQARDRFAARFKRFARAQNQAAFKRLFRPAGGAKTS